MSAGPEAEEHHDPPMTIGEHLEALRLHVLRCVLYVIGGLVLCLAFQDYLIAWATWPHQRTVAELNAEALLHEAPSDLQDLLAEVDREHRALGRAAGAARRRILALRERVRPSRERLRDLREQQRALRERLAALAGEAEALSDEDPSAEAVERLERERDSLGAELASLEERVQRDVAPFLDPEAHAPHIELIQIKYQEGFISLLKLALVAGIFLTSPLCAWELWRFVAVGLYPHEKRYVNLFAPLTFGAFLLGATFGYFVLIPFGLKFLATYAPPELVSGTFALGDYLSLFTTLTIVVGLVFELPLVMTFFTLINIGGSAFYRRYRRHMLLGAFIVAAVITPPDPATQCLLAIPLICLYEVGIGCSSLIERRRAAENAAGHANGAEAGHDPAAIAPPTSRGPAPDRPAAADSSPNVPTPRAEEAAPTADPAPRVAPPVGERVARGTPDAASGSDSVRRAGEDPVLPDASAHAGGKEAPRRSEFSVEEGGEEDPASDGTPPIAQPTQDDGATAGTIASAANANADLPEDIRRALTRQRAFEESSRRAADAGSGPPPDSFVDPDGRVWRQPDGEEEAGIDGDNDDPTLVPEDLPGASGTPTASAEEASASAEE
ncbi:MAG: twin-arginine translocase subunit TatC, partial [Planctomycetota bacterium]